MRLVSCLYSAKKVGELTKRFSNLPDSYIERAMEQVSWRTPKNFPQYLNREVKRKEFKFSTHRPWTAEFRQENAPGKRITPVYLEPVLEWSIFRGDRVELLVGRDKGKQGIVNQIIQERNWVIVEGLNCSLRTIGKEKDFPGVMVKWENPLLVTNEVALVDPSDLKPTAIEWRYTESGEKVRVSMRSGRIIPMPTMAEETMDYKTKGTYKEASKDTTNEHLSAVTFSPKLRTFEMDIMSELGIVEERVPAKTFWY